MEQNTKPIKPHVGEVLISRGVKYKALASLKERCQRCTFFNPLQCQKPKNWNCEGLRFERVVKRFDCNDKEII